MQGRIPPHSPEAEKSVLGAAMLSKEALYDTMEIVRPDDFYDENHKEIFRAIIELNKRNAPVDVLTVSEELQKRNTLTMVGGRTYLSTLSESTPSTANAGEYAKIISEKSAIRSLISAADNLIARGYEEKMEATQLMDYAESSIFDIAQSKQKSQYTPLRDVLTSNIEMIDQASKLDGGLTGITTGFKGLDEMTSGLQKSDLIILAARPSMGKTAFALSVTLNAALKGGASVMMFSLEMSKELLGQRLLAMESKVEMQKIKTGKLDRRDWDDINIALESLSKAKIHIDDNNGMTIMEMKSKCRRLKAEEGLDLVVIDYLGLMNPEGRAESRNQEISVLSRNLKMFAKELNCPVLVLSQLSRGPETRTDHRPMLSDLRDSGSIEQDADMVMFLYRDEYYNKDTENPGECEINLAKHRNGPTGVVNVTWLDKTTRFVDLAKSQWNE